jgi:folate-binding protein YgfZ
MISLPYLSAIHFSGIDAGDFLHNQLSADVMALTDGESTFACYCEPKGRVLALMLVYRLGEDYYVVMSSSLASSITDRMRIYVMRSQVTIVVLTDDTVSGLQADDEPQQPSNPIRPIPLPHSDKWLVVATEDSGTVSEPGVQDAWKISELQDGISWLCPETSGQFLPQMLGFDQLGAVNYRKGCYPGQEIVARTHYLGKVKRHPRLLCTSTAICPDPMEKIQILSEDQAYEAIVSDCGRREDGGSCLFTITRMDPDLTAEKLEYQGQSAPVLL